MTRNLIERTFSAWKSKFQCLKGLRLKLSTSLAVVNACAVLWNFLLAERETSREEVEEEHAIDEYCLLPSVSHNMSQSSTITREGKREILLRTCFTELLSKTRDLPAHNSFSEDD